MGEDGVTSGEPTFRRCAATAWRRVADEVIVVDLGRREMYGLNEAAGSVWEALAVACKPPQLVDGEGGDRDLVDEVRRFCHQLLELGLIEEVSGSQPGSTAAECVVEPERPDIPSITAPPKVLWHEQIRRVSASCAFFPATSPLCNQVPFS